MATQRAIDEADIRRRMDEWAKAIRTMDLDGVTSNYAPDIVSFDLAPPLRHAGAEAKRNNWIGVFARFHVRSITMFATSRSSYAMKWHLRTASIGSAARRRMGRRTIFGSVSRRV
jgi:ketosteroid isomerase-like protein